MLKSKTNLNLLFYKIIVKINFSNLIEIKNIKLFFKLNQLKNSKCFKNTQMLRKKTCFFIKILLEFKLLASESYKDKNNKKAHTICLKR